MISSELAKFVKEYSDEYFNAIRIRDCKNDSNSPYQSLYRSRDILTSILGKLKDINTSDHCNFKRVTAVLHFRLGINFVETEESPSGEEHFKQCRALIDACEGNSEHNFGITQALLNQQGLLYCQRSDFEHGLQTLLEAKSIYQNFSRESDVYPWTVDDFFRIESYCDELNSNTKKERIDALEDAFTHTLYFLAQVYGKMGRCFDSAEYCKETLKRQLSRHKYEALDWSMNAATLSQFYMANSDYLVARHCLASAELILKEFGDKPSNLFVDVGGDDTQEDVDAKEKLSKAWADLYRCWIKYALSLLEYSRERLYQKLEENDVERETLESEQIYEGEKELFNLDVSSIEGRITEKPVLVFNEAREVFLCCQKWISGAKEFYVLDGHCSDHVELIKDYSSLFKLLAFFEVDLNRQCKMFKRRADMLAEVLRELNPQCYLSLCHQLSFEIGEVYSSMLDNKLALLELSTESDDKHRQLASKINSLAKNSIEYFQLFIRYLKNHEGNLPEKFSEELERPALMAHFYCGRLFSKFMTSDRLEQLSNTSKSLEYYKYLVEYCKTNPSANEKVQEERSACEEMVQLLPAKMDRIRSMLDK